MTETINGLHSCKPGNEPIEGEVKTFVIEHRPAKGTKKAWIKIKSAGEKFGGTPFRILSAAPTGFTDDHGNISFNLEVEPSSSAPTVFQQARSTMQQGRVPRDDDTQVYKREELLHPPDSDWPEAQQGTKTEPPLGFPPHKGNESPPARHKPSMLDERQRAIIRQHSQSMALEVLKLKVTLNELTVEDLTPAKLRSLADYFDADVIGAAE